MSFHYTLNNGVEIPAIGFGTYRTPPGEVTEQSVLAAIQAGYRSIDCAAAYKNETSVGAAIKKSGIGREQLFITSKLWNDEKGYESTRTAFEKTLRDLQLEYLDLYLIHWPIAKASRNNWKEANAETWRAFEELYQAGKIRAIGVSNFRRHHLEGLLETAKIKPMVNQIEYHPGFLQEETVQYSKKHDLLIEAWAPLSNGGIFKNEALIDLAAKYKKSVAQITLRWILQKGMAPLPKSITPGRMKENLDVFDFEISPEDSAVIDQIGDCGYSGFDPDDLDY
jgi:diketogulonate reductase-like aldo/keto reductase